MALRDFLFGFKFIATDYVSPVLKNIQGRIEAVNEQVKATASWREVGTNMAVVGAGIAAVGGGVALTLKRFVDSAADIDEHLRHLSTTLDSGAAGVRELAQAHELAAKWSVRYNYAQKDIIDNLYKSISFTGDYNSGLAVTMNSLAVAKGNLGDATKVGESLSIMLNDWPGKVGHTADQAQRLADLLAYTSRHGPFEDVGQLTAGLDVAIGSVKAVGLSAEDTMAMLQAYSRVGMVGTEAGTAMMETLQAFAKGKLQTDLGVALATTKSGALDMIGTMVNLRRELGSGVITVNQWQRAVAALGIRGQRALAVNVDDLVAFQKQLYDPSVIKGAAMQGATEMMGAFSEQMGVLGKKWDILSEMLGRDLLGPIQRIGSALGHVLDATISFATAHPQIVKFVVTFAAIGAAIAVVVGGAAALVGGLMMAASFLPIGGGILATIGLIGTAIAGVSAAVITFRGLFSGAFSALSHPIDAVIGKVKALWNSIDIGARLAGAAVIGFVAPMYLGSAATAAWSAAIVVARGAVAAWSAVTDAAAIKQAALAVASKAWAIAQGVASAATGIWTAAQWALNAAWAANPIGLVIGGALLLGAVIYEVYEHTKLFGETWRAVSGVFEATVGTISAAAVAVGGAVVSAFKGFGNWFAGWAATIGKVMYSAGANLIKQLVAGIESMAMAPVHAVEKVAAAIRAYLPFSPAHEGPLRTLNRVRIIETIADTIQPGPAVNAMRLSLIHI